MNIVGNEPPCDFVISPCTPGSNVNVRTSRQGSTVTVVNVQHGGRSVNVESPGNRGGSRSILVPSPPATGSGSVNMQSARQSNNGTIVNFQGGATSVNVWSPRKGDGLPQVWVTLPPNAAMVNTASGSRNAGASENVRTTGQQDNGPVVNVGSGGACVNGGAAGSSVHAQSRATCGPTSVNVRNSCNTTAVRKTTCGTLVEVGPSRKC
eukprot:GEMP01058243.1.p1 GENE.GEMP01058243.1~~GEMP01058243.1.p1  ORF type:complete len:208 (+),score=52.12 GEMP01058243.1:138-761(+)